MGNCGFLDGMTQPHPSAHSPSSAPSPPTSPSAPTSPHHALRSLLPGSGGSGREWDAVAAGESGAAVFRRSDGAAYAKCVPPEASSDLGAERDRVAWLAGTGIPGPEVLEWASREAGACLVTSTVPGVPADTLTSGALRAAWPALVRLLRRIHELPPGDCPFERRLETMVRVAEDVVRRGAVEPAFLAEEQRGVPAATLLADLRAELPARLAQEEADLAVCHGDACLPNFLVDPDTSLCTGVIDLGRLGVADRHADLALLRASAEETWTGDDGAHADRVLAEHCSPDSDRLRFYLHLDPLTWG